MQQMIFIADLIACSTCFGHHYAHHQELEIIILVVAACRIWCLVFKLSLWCGSEGCVCRLRAAALLALLHLFGILFPHINDDARSKPHQTQREFSDIYIYIYIYILPWHDSPQWAKAVSLSRIHDHT